MARPLKKGLDYFPFDVGFFLDKKIRALRGHYGADGIAVYLYLLCSIYSEGYYILDDMDLMDAIVTDLGMTEDKIGQIKNFLLSRSLLKSILIKSDKVLTSEGIQRQYQECVRARALKNAVTVDGRIWLLEESETCGFIKVRPQRSFSENNPNYSKKNPSYSENNDINKSKVNKGKENNIPAADIFENYADGDNDLLTALRDYEAMRSQMKKPLSDRAKQLAVNKLSELADNNADRVKIINQSVFNIWQGLFPLKNTTKQDKPTTETKWEQLT